jgi:DNA-binding MarR family transcriptional regulator
LSQKLEITNIFYDLREVRIVNNLKLRPAHKLVLFVLEARGKKIFPTKLTIAGDCGYSKATVDKVIRELVEFDLIKIKPRFNKSNRYFINKDAIHEVAQELQMEASLKKSVEIQIDDPDYDPWEEEAIIVFEKEEEFVDIEIDEITRIKNEQALSSVWDSLNSVSSQS